jgi:hypothetical protein
MAVNTERGAPAGAPTRSGWLDRPRRLTTETKHSSKTTELYAYIAAVVGILIAAAVIGADDNAGRGETAGDYFTAYDAWRLIAFLTIGYMVARGLAKAGSRDPYWEGGTNAERGDGGRDR